MMDTIFSGYERILAGGDRRLRQAALDIVEEGIKKVVPYEAVKRLIQFDGNTIRMGDGEITMDAVRNIYVVGAGKGSFPIARALDEIFGERIKKGFVAVKEGETRRLGHIEIFESSHPIPDERSVEAADRIMDILQEAGEKDLIFAAVTGGSSALLNRPAGDISMEHLREINAKLLNCGAEIGKINTVRKHICLLKGGRLVKYGQPAMVVTLTFDTAPPDMPWPDLCLPDPTTFSEAIEVLENYQLWEETPDSIRGYLLHGKDHPELETLKSLEDMKQMIFSVADPQTACEAAAARARQRGYEPYILSTTMEGEAKDVGAVIAGITDEILEYDRPFTTPCALISGGETTVTIRGVHGVGGPNQETVLGFAEKIRHKRGYVFISMDTDGTDGPCNKAGGIVDGETLRKAGEKGICIERGLYEHDSAQILEALGDDLITGHTGTNVMNLRVALIDRRGADGKDR